MKPEMRSSENIALMMKIIGERDEKCMPYALDILAFWKVKEAIKLIREVVDGFGLDIDPDCSKHQEIIGRRASRALSELQSKPIKVLNVIFQILLLVGGLSILDCLIEVVKLIPHLFEFK